MLYFILLSLVVFVWAESYADYPHPCNDFRTAVAPTTAMGTATTFRSCSWPFDEIHDRAVEIAQVFALVLTVGAGLFAVLWKVLPSQLRVLQASILAVLVGALLHYAYFSYITFPEYAHAHYPPLRGLDGFIHFLMTKGLNGYFGNAS
jgi:hypothetical protein